jgi:hypothetical protein
MKLHTLYLSRLRNEELFQFQTELHTLVKNTEPVKTALGTALYAEFNRLKAGADDALQATGKSAFTPRIAAQDAARDRLYAALRTLAALYAAEHYDPAKRPPAAQLLVTIEKYRRDIDTGTYNEETAAITNLIEDLRDPAISAPRVEALGLGGWADALDTANKKFESDLNARYAEAAARPGGSMTALRPAIEQNLRDLFEKINALAILNPDTVAVQDFVTALNLRIDAYARAAARHHARKSRGGGGDSGGGGDGDAGEGSDSDGGSGSGAEA